MLFRSLAYEPQFIVADLCCDIDPPHRVLGEIDASGMTRIDADHFAARGGLIMEDIKTTRREIKHTPGPWAVIGREIHGPDDSGAIVARIPEWGALADTADPGPNNARLIAAAPDLLAALDQLLSVTVDKDLKEGWTLSDDARIARDQAIAAIAKATQGV